MSTPATRVLGVANQVRPGLHALPPSGRHVVELVGQNLGLSTRSLQCQLEQAGESIPTWTMKCAEISLRHLGHPACSIWQVGGLRGFSEVSAQFGMPPVRWRSQAPDRPAG